MGAQAAPPGARPLIPLGAALALMALYYAGLATGHAAICMVAKPIPAGCLALLALGAPPSRYARWMAAGLAISVFGDLFLELGQSSFLLGVGSFLLAHLCYIAAFVSAQPSLRPIRLIPFLVWGGVAFWLISARLGPMLAPVAVYMCVICCMMWRSAAALDPRGPCAFARWSGLIGALLFGASDTLIALGRWHPSVRASDLLVMTVYWSGQIGLALSAALAEPAIEAGDNALRSE
jgi:uncharacterized membrane protein YhhN